MGTVIVESDAAVLDYDEDENGNPLPSYSFKNSTDMFGDSGLKATPGSCPYGPDEKYIVHATPYRKTGPYSYRVDGQLYYVADSVMVRIY